MLVVGLTGGIATGKSSVSKQLQDGNVPLIDLDILARQAVAKGTTGLQAIVSEFGSQVLREEGDLDRAALGRVIFNDESKRKKLNKIIHPRVRVMTVKTILWHWLRGERMVVVDTPLLVEAGFWKFCGWIVVVWCSEQEQFQRLINRDTALSEDDAKSRIAAQMPVSKKLVYADTVIDNSSTHDHREQQVRALLQTLYQHIGWSWKLSWLIPPVGIVRAALRAVYRLLILRIGSTQRRVTWKVDGDKLIKQD